MKQLFFGNKFNGFNFHLYSCRECDTYYWDLDRLRSHLSRCSRKQDKPSLCDICGKEFRNESFLRAHRRDHLDLKRIYECVFCRKSVYNKPYMRHHIRTAHVGGKPKSSVIVAIKHLKERRRSIGIRRFTRMTSHSNAHTVKRDFDSNIISMYVVILTNFYFMLEFRTIIYQKFTF